VEELKGPLATLWGVYYPTGYVVAVVPDDATAQNARDALAAAGFTSDDVRLFSGEEIVGIHERFMKDRNLAQRLVGMIDSDEREARDEYLAEARAGRCLVTVHAEQEERVKTAHAALAQHGAYAVRHYDKNTLHDL
jgi:hypothetical protein